MAYLVQQKRLEKPGKESIHSGHFMVSQFEAEEQDDEDNVAVPIPEVLEAKPLVPNRACLQGALELPSLRKSKQQICIDQSLSKLFECMSLAYRQKLTSPKWNRFRGIRLRWKDKIRLNNVIWRCWHLQFIKKENTLICQFASPLDVDTHNKPEAIVLEGKYWKRKLAAVTAEYKKWRMFYRNHIYGHTPKEEMEMMNDVDAILADSNSMDTMNMMIDEDYMGLMSDTLFSTIANQPYAFPDTRELAKSGFADFIQPSLGPLQPNLDDYMDTFDPLQDVLYMHNKLPTVPEEQQHPINWDYPGPIRPSDLPPLVAAAQTASQYQPHIPELTRPSGLEKPQDSQIAMFNNAMLPPQPYIQSSSYSIISKITPKSNHGTSRGKLSHGLIGGSFGKSMDNPNKAYPGYGTTPILDHVSRNDRLQQVPMVAKPSQPQQHRTQVQDLPVNEPQFRPQVQPSTGSAAYKFSATNRPNLKFTSPNVQQQPKDIKVEHQNRATQRGRGRSRSNTREPMKRPPLLSASSDTALITPQTNALLTQLLTSNAPLAETVQSWSANHNMPPSRVKEEAKALPVLKNPSVSVIPLTSQISVNTVSLTNGDSSYLSTYSGSNSPLDSPSQNLHSPTSSQGSMGSPSREGSRDRRVGHIHAEQKRRCNIKNGFDMINSLIPQLNQNPNAKLSKAMRLQKGAEYIRTLRAERHHLKEEMDSLRQEIESLNTSISNFFRSNCQSMLPATGAPVSRRRDSRMQEMFDDYVRNRTMENWKFWIFSLICRPLLASFNNFVSSSSLDDLYSSTLLWVEQHCTLVDLRPVVLNSLRYLCTKTEILSEPDKLPEEARQLVLKKDMK
ncbi:MLX-interacting protein isoform X3 [Dendroctonus ponderosae]|uniref:BHLH domain-containing protein n=1 Tax=Dendroctonus ponderosae TaxID=77166 RepID=A0AAR5Q1Q0_DENPD|nr:MLX-interacting protein isoform X3 [Dendroctonus ponderosae]